MHLTDDQVSRLRLAERMHLDFLLLQQLLLEPELRGQADLQIEQTEQDQAKKRR